jgi:hypothetical protein
VAPSLAAPSLAAPSRCSASWWRRPTAVAVGRRGGGAEGTRARGLGGGGTEVACELPRCCRGLGRAGLGWGARLARVLGCQGRGGGRQCAAHPARAPAASECDVRPRTPSARASGPRLPHARGTFAALL